MSSSIQMKPLMSVEDSQVKPVSATHEYNSVPSDVFEDQLEKRRRRDAIFKKRIRIYRGIARAISVVLSGYMVAIQAMTLAKYYTTRNHMVGGRNAWAKDTQVWPSVEQLAIAFVTFALNIAIIISYVRGVKAANRVEDLSSTFEYTVSTGQIIVWLVTVVLYKVGKTGNDLWGWSCSDKAAAIQDQFKDVVTFDNTSTWYASIAQNALEILAFLVYAATVRRWLNKRKISKMQEF
ncbi:MAG: hypothetical protein M1812_000264 [Candelaria pacifica]|nr:MAG: hypothetical protein M1812_000264 [Candelaria pacifica]